MAGGSLGLLDLLLTPGGAASVTPPAGGARSWLFLCGVHVQGAVPVTEPEPGPPVVHGVYGGRLRRPRPVPRLEPEPVELEALAVYDRHGELHIVLVPSATVSWTWQTARAGRVALGVAPQVQVGRWQPLAGTMAARARLEGHRDAVWTTERAGGALLEVRHRAAVDVEDGEPLLLMEDDEMLVGLEA